VKSRGTAVAVALVQLAWQAAAKNKKGIRFPDALGDAVPQN
jgi:hypothetical protein